MAFCFLPGTHDINNTLKLPYSHIKHDIIGICLLKNQNSMEDFKSLAVGSIGLGSVHLLDVTAPTVQNNGAALFDAIVKLLIAIATVYSLIRKKPGESKPS